MAKLPPRLTGLPIPLWVMPNAGYPNDVRIKVSRISGERGRRDDAVPVKP
jgi:hypothetical protein